MAKRTDKKIITATPAAKSGADDLTALNPKICTGTISGKTITCREYGFIEELELRYLSQPFIDDLCESIKSSEKNTKRGDDLLVAKHIHAIQTLVAKSADVEVDWVRSLNRSEGQKLFNLWWSANGPFFIGCATDYLRSQLLAKMKDAGQISTQP